MPDDLKILIVESDQRAALSLATALRQQNWDVVSASDAIMAQTVALKTRPNAIVLSAQLHGGGGLVALKRMRSSVHTAVVPVIAIAPTGVQKQELLAAGAQECFEQSVAPWVICNAIRKHLSQTIVVTEAPAEIIRSPERLAGLQDTGLLDSAPEESFDRITQLAAKLVGAPAAIISLVDKDRQFFKSQVGLEAPWSVSRQTPLSYSFCQWVVSGRTELTVRDAREHPALRTNLGVKELGVSAYAGIPLYELGGQALGSLCAVDPSPRPWLENELDILRDLAKVVEAYIVIKQGLKEGKLSNGVQAHSAPVLPIASGILGATRVLRRDGSRLTAAERGQLLAIVEEQAAHLVQNGQSGGKSRK